MDNSLLLALYFAQIFKFLHPRGFLVHKSVLDEHGASDDLERFKNELCSASSLATLQESDELFVIRPYGDSYPLLSELTPVKSQDDLDNLMDRVEELMCRDEYPDAPTGEPGPAEQTAQEPPVVDESLGVLPSIPRGLIKNESECLEALAPLYVNYPPHDHPGPQV